MFELRFLSHSEGGWPEHRVSLPICSEDCWRKVPVQASVSRWECCCRFKCHLRKSSEDGHQVVCFVGQMVRFMFNTDRVGEKICFKTFAQQTFAIRFAQGSCEGRLSYKTLDWIWTTLPQSFCSNQRSSRQMIGLEWIHHLTDEAR